MDDYTSSFKQAIRELTDRLEKMKTEPQNVEEFTVHGNAIRRCDHLEDINRVQDQIIDIYSKYAAALEEAMGITTAIQHEITSLIKQHLNQ